VLHRPSFEAVCQTVPPPPPLLLQGFLGSDWQEPSEFKGCGKFVSDSWRIFCKGAREAKGEAAAVAQQTVNAIAMCEQCLVVAGTGSDFRQAAVQKDVAAAAIIKCTPTQLQRSC
jgi:hypothetical protein